MMAVTLRSRMGSFFWPNFQAKDVPEAERLLGLCKKTVQKSAQHLSASDYAMNPHQCNLLVKRLSGVMETTLADAHQSELLDKRAIPVLQELHQTLLDADMLIQASCITLKTSDQWPRAAIEQHDLKETFAKLLYDVQWYKSVLLSILVDNSKESRIKFGPEKCDGKLSLEDEFDLLTAMKKDEESLKGRLRSENLKDPTNQGIVEELLKQMDSPSPHLLSVESKALDVHGKVIGRGGYGTVQITNLMGSECAMKVIQLPDEDDSEDYVKPLFQKEMDIIKELGQHPHIVRLLCCSISDTACYFIMEKMQMDLSKYLRRRVSGGQNLLSIVEAVSLMIQIGEGMEYIHSKRVVHRDLKPENVLINLENPSTISLSKIRSVKIADFGVSKTRGATRTYSNQTIATGTTMYMAPEVIKLSFDDPDKAKFNPRKADVYSFSIMCSVILSGETKQPYGIIGAKEMKEGVKAGTLRPRLPPNCYPRLATLIRQCWAGISEKRPLFDVICKELRYIKALLLRGDEVELNTGFGTPEMEGAKIDGPWGGVNGIKFIDTATSIKGIKLKYSRGEYALIGSMEVTYEAFGITFVKTYCVGRNGKEETKIVFKEFEFIECISGFHSTLVVNTAGKKRSTIDCVVSLTIHTNLERYGPFGEEKGEAFSSSVGRIIGFHGAAEACLDSIGVVIIPGDPNDFCDLN